MANLLHAYRLAPSLEVLRRNWDDESVVYVPTSRETHLLNVPCVFVLGALEGGPATATELTHQMQQSLDDAEPQEVSNLLREIVDQLSRIGMIEALEEAS